MPLLGILDGQGRDDQLEPEFTPAFQAWKTTPTPKTRGALLTAVNPVLDTAIKSYGGGAAGSPTLKSRARLAALTAFDSYDPKKGRLKTHLLSQLQGLRRVSAQEQNIIGIPEQVGLDAQHMRDAENMLRDQIGRDPSDAELADYTGLSVKRLGYIRQARGSVAEGTVQQPDAEGNVYTPASIVPGQQDPGLDAWIDYLYADLGPADRIVLDCTLGRNGQPKLTPVQIARKLGVTQGAVSQRAAKIQQLIDSRNDLGVL